MDYIDMNIEDAIIEKPHCFSVDLKDGRTRNFYIFPTTLGKTFLLKRHIANLNIDYRILECSPFLEALRIVTENREEVCRVITYHTLKKKRDIFDQSVVNETISVLMENTTNEELSSLLIYILTKDMTDQFKKHLGITKEQERMRKVAEAKRRVQKSQNNFEFGRKTIYGTLIDTACERYGWSYDYVMWGISLTNLQLMLADRMQDIYLSDKEKEKISSRLLNSEDTINADDKANMEKILAMNWR